MKHFFPAMIFVSLLLLAGCKDTAIVDEAATGTNRTFTLKATMPGTDDPATRVATEQKAGGKGIVLKWKEGNKIQLYFKEGNNITKGDEVYVQNISADGKNAQFEVAVPQEITGGFDLFGVHGAASEVTNGEILLDACPSSMMQLKDIVVPIFFKLEVTDPNAPVQTVAFKHYGALHVLTLKNTENKKITLENPSFDFSGEKWYYDAAMDQVPVYDVVSEKPKMVSNTPPSPNPLMVEIGYEDNVKLAQWIMPNDNEVPEINLKAVIDANVKTTPTKPARGNKFVVGKAYHLYALWDGNSLLFTQNADDVQANNITMTIMPNTTDIRLDIYADFDNRGDVWIDLNGDGVRDVNGDEDVKLFTEFHTYTITSQTVTLHGKVVYLDCNSNSLTGLDVSNATALNDLHCNDNSLEVLNISNAAVLTGLYCQRNSLKELNISNDTALTSLYCYDNQIKDEAMTNLVKSLPLRDENDRGEFYVINLNSKEEGNVCTAAQVGIATAQNWEVLDKDDNPYDGS